MVRSDTAGATHKFAQPCRDRCVGFSFGFPSTPGSGTPWTPSTSPRAGTQPSTPAVRSATERGWPRPRPGQPVDLACRNPTCAAQRAPAPRSAAAVHRHRRHAHHRVHHRHRPRCRAGATGRSGAAPSQAHRVEDRIREVKPPGLTNLPCQDFQSNAAWLEIVLAAADLVAWAQLIGFTDTPSWPAARSPPSATGCCVAARITAAPDNPAAHRHHLALGRRHRHRLATTPRRLPLTVATPVPPTRKTHRHRKARSPRRHGRDKHTPSPKWLLLSAFRGSASPDPTGMQNRGSAMKAPDH